MARQEESKRPSKAERDAIWRNYQLLRAGRSGVAVTVDGIALDLRHGLDPDIWQPLSPFGLYSHRSALAGPEIILPWTPPDWRKHFESKGPVIVAATGARVFVVRVLEWPLQSNFEDLEHPANREAKLVYYAIAQPGGDTQIAQRGQVFVRQSAVANLIASGDYSAAYRGMLKRLEDALGVDDAEELADASIKDWPEFAPTMSPAFGAAFLALRDREKDIDGHAMAAFGYLIARAEAEAQLLDPAKRGVRSLNHARQASLAKSARDQAHLAPLIAAAKALCREDKTLSLNRCAKQLALTFNKDDRWIAKKIKPLFELRPNGREYQPRLDQD